MLLAPCLLKSNVKLHPNCLLSSFKIQGLTPFFYEENGTAGPFWLGRISGMIEGKDLRSSMRGQVISAISPRRDSFF
jgi:hypothetical protein